MSNLIERAALTDEELSRAYFAFQTISPVDRAIAKAATEKAVRVVLEELEPLVEAGNQMLEVISEEWGRDSTDHPWTAALAQCVDVRAE